MPDYRVLLQVQQAVAQAEAEFGPLDVVIANAGMPSSSEPIHSIDDSPIGSRFLKLLPFEVLGATLHHLRRL